MIVYAILLGYNYFNTKRPEIYLIFCHLSVNVIEENISLNITYKKYIYILKYTIFWYLT